MRYIHTIQQAHRHLRRRGLRDTDARKLRRLNLWLCVILVVTYLLTLWAMGWNMRA